MLKGNIRQRAITAPDMPKWQLRGILLSCLLIFCVAPILALGSDVFKTQNGYGFTWFLALYLWGGYIRMYTPKLSRKLYPPPNLHRRNLPEQTVLGF